MTGCASGEPSQDQGTTSGPAYSEPTNIYIDAFDENAAEHFSDCAIDASTAPKGYVGARGTASTKLKFQVTCNGNSYNYDLPEDGSPIYAPINMGDGSYTFRIMQNTSGSNYAEVGSTSANVQLESQFAPFLHPNVFCNYTPQSECVERAFMLAQDAENEGDVVRNVYDWLVEHIEYDDAKAEELSSTTGYIPNPDDTLSDGSGICFDYASLAAAMFRSLGIPCQIVTGYVSPNQLYHAWNMVYIDGEWISARVSVEPDKWCRVDITFAAAQQNDPNVGNGETYTDRYVY